MLRRPLLALLPATLSLAATTESDSPPLPAATPAAEPASEPAVELTPLEVTATALDVTSPGLPVAITTYDGAFVTQNRIDTAAAMAPITPGFFASEQSINNPSYSLRGITTDSVDPRSEERVAVYQDGVPISRTSGASVALFDLDRVDVYKGPEPTRFLRGAQSGALSLVSKSAQNERSGALTVGVGDYSATFAEAFINTPLVVDKLFARVAFTATERDGYVDNLTPGAEALQSTATAALRASLRWQPSARTTLDVVFNHQNDTPSGAAFKSMDIPTRAGDTDPFSAADLNRGDELGVDRSIQSLAATLRTELSPAWTLTSTTSGRQFDVNEEFDADGSRAYLLELGTDHQSEQLGQEIRFNYDAGERFSGGIGAGAFWEKGRQKVTVRSDERVAWAFLSDTFRQGLIDVGVPAGTAAFLVPELDAFGPESGLPTTLPATFAFFPPLAPLAGAPLSSYQEEHYFTDAEYGSLDLFGDADYKLNERLTVGVAARVTAESIESGYESIDSGTSVLGFLQTGGSGNLAYRPTPGRLSATEDNVGWAGRVHARYTLAPTHELFAAVSRGRRPPTVSFDQTTLETVRLDEEIVWNYETGVRGALAAGRFGYSASVYQYYYDHFQTNVVTGPGVISSTDGGRARGKGFETTLQGAVNRHLALFGSYGFTDAQFSSLDEDGASQAYAGNTFRLSARHAFSLGGTVTMPAFDRGAFYLSPVFQYKSEAFFEDDNARSDGRLRQGGYGLVNLTLAYRPRAGFWEAAIYSDNLLDRDYLIDAGNLGAAFGIPTTVRGAPRTVGAKFTARF
ncbi:MAG: TonB-dependent receptor plug domain-containing protein [Burkholderiales bacterium]|nr:TonB-dependent receptor plug domain-containing protein [Opitutaceae bacterium]